jgi:hypothetical protein
MDGCHEAQTQDRYVHPALRIGQLWWVECTVCGTESFGSDVPRFASEEQLWATVTAARPYGWTRRDDGRVLCRHHSAVADCDAGGHDVGPWTVHPIGDDLQWRYCQRCGGSFEQRIGVEMRSRG